MNIAILSDIHSNHFALDAVIKEFEKYNIHKIIIAGDTFGYYPWASETFKLLKPFLQNAICIKGNHDQLLLDENPPAVVPSYWPAAKQNEKELSEEYPEALQWLQKLEYVSEFKIENKKITLIHGSPDDYDSGRYYPDDETEYHWLPGNEEILILGHTHYPMLKINSKKGITFNPGSVGQPRDGNPMPSWGLFDTDNLSFQHIRTDYDNHEAMKVLKSMNWDARAIQSLNKTRPGSH